MSDECEVFGSELDEYVPYKTPLSDETAEPDETVEDLLTRTGYLPHLEEDGVSQYLLCEVAHLHCDEAVDVLECALVELSDLRDQILYSIR